MKWTQPISSGGAIQRKSIFRSSVGRRFAYECKMVHIFRCRYYIMNNRNNKNNDIDLVALIETVPFTCLPAESLGVVE